MLRRWLLLLALSAPVAAQPYTNPVIPLAETETADPFVLKWNGEYYLYCSGDPIVAYHSVDLVHWDRVGPVLASNAAAWNQADVWAPEVVYRNGKFYMYYTAATKSSDWRVNEISRRVGVAVSSSPRGPFVDSGKPVMSAWAIDGDVFRDPRSGKAWLFYSSLQEPRRPGAAIALDALPVWNRALGKPTLVTQGDRAWEDKDGDPNNGSLRYTNEGPTALYHHGKYYCLYSGGSWDLPNYSVGYAMAPSLAGPWEKVAPPILRSTPWIDGPGHNCVVKAPNNLDDIQLYHARLQPYVDPWNRVPFAERLYWNGDRPWCQTPSLAFQAPPDKPVFADRFDGGLARWQTGPGWRVEGGELHSEGGEAKCRVDLPGFYVLEVNLRVLGTKAGVQIGKRKLVLDAAQSAICLDSKPVWKWPADFRPSDYHQLILRRNDGATLQIEVDGVKRGRLELGGLVDGSDSGREDRSWRLTAQGSAAFDGVSLSAAFDDDFRESSKSFGNWLHTVGSWAAEKGEMVCSTPQGLAFKGEYATSFEFSATLQPRDTAAPQVAHPGPTDKKWSSGVIALGPRGGWLEFGYDKAIWPLGRFHISRHDDRDSVITAADPLDVPMPRGFRYDVPHTIRVVRQEDLFTAYLDGVEVAAGRFSIDKTRPGLYTDGVACKFSHCTYKRLGVEQNWLLDGGFETQQYADGKPAYGCVWKFSGAAKINQSQPFTGTYRLRLGEGASEARQPLTLPPGHFRLHGFATGTRPLHVQAGGKTLDFPVNQLWQAFRLDFDSTQQDLLLSAQGAGWTAVDDLYLERVSP